MNAAFLKFKEAGLKIKLSKCQFFKTQLQYLRHKISANGLEPLPEKLEVIKNLAPTKNMDEAHQILGLLGYYRSFPPAFANITIPITNLLQKNTPFIWLKMPTCIRLFKRNFLQQTPIAVPRPKQRLCIVHRCFE